MSKQYNGSIFIANSLTQRRQFWLDRANTAAIASHTNAFKINEDVVIPLNKLAHYTDEIDRINIELSLENKVNIAQTISSYILSLIDDKNIELADIVREKYQL